MKQNFLIKRENYKKIEAGMKAEGFEPVEMLIIPTILPFEIPMEDQGLNQIFKTGDYWIYYKFKIIEERPTYNEDLFVLKTFMEGRVKRRTYVEIGFMSKTPLQLSSASEHFETSLLFLTALLGSLRIVALNAGICPVSKQQLQSDTSAIIYTLPDWQPKEEGYLTLNFDSFREMHTDGKVVTEDLNKKAVEYARVNMYQSVNPFLFSEYAAFESLRHYQEGSYSEAVVSIGTSVESFFKTLYRLFKQNEGVSDTDINKKLEKLAFRHLIEHQIAKKLGVTWNFKDGNNSPCGIWHDYSYKYRNQIVHSGISPSIIQAHEAFKYASNFKYEAIKIINNDSDNILIKNFLEKLTSGTGKLPSVDLFETSERFYFQGMGGKYDELLVKYMAKRAGTPTIRD